MFTDEGETLCDGCGAVLTNAKGERVKSATFSGGVWCDLCYKNKEDVK